MMVFFLMCQSDCFLSVKHLLSFPVISLCFYARFFDGTNLQKGFEFQSSDLQNFMRTKSSPSASMSASVFLFIFA